MVAGVSLSLMCIRTAITALESENKIATPLKAQHLGPPCTQEKAGHLRVTKFLVRTKCMIIKFNLK